MLGWIIGRIMESETALENDATLDRLALQPSDTVLEIGFGPGRALERAARRVPRGRVVGIDLSDEMSKVAARHCAELIGAGRVELQRADAARLPFPSACFDKAYAVHTLYFWQEPAQVLTELRRVLRPGGTLALCYRPRSDPATQNFPATVYRFLQEADVAAKLRETGFVSIETSSCGPSGRLRVTTACA
jgi:ubiquinone/menaquinone biosynthesis C-methylase UbiE